MKSANLTETNRVEAFSDGVFSIIVTLLVLEIRRPDAPPGQLGQQLLEQWPSYLAYVMAFVYVGIIWLNHHGLFRHIGKVSMGLNVCNLIGLATTALIPFPTGVLSTAFRLNNVQDQHAAVVLYAIVAGMMSAAWLPIFPYLNRHRELLKPETNANIFAAEIIRPVVGVATYGLAAVVGWFFNPLYAIALFVFMIFYHAWTSQGLSSRKRKS